MFHRYKGRRRLIGINNYFSNIKVLLALVLRNKHIVIKQTHFKRFLYKISAKLTLLIINTKQPLSDINTNQPTSFSSCSCFRIVAISASSESIFCLYFSITDGDITRLLAGTLACLTISFKLLRPFSPTNVTDLQTYTKVIVNYKNKNTGV